MERSECGELGGEESVVEVERKVERKVWKVWWRISLNERDYTGGEAGGRLSLPAIKC